jgi:hypothetical protein
MAGAAYSERYCAFIDILGFSGLIRDLEHGKVSVEEIYKVLSAFHTPSNPARPQDADLRYQSISDAVALSAAPNAAGLNAICKAAEELSRRLLRAGYFTRGGLTKGSLYHNRSMVFGPALVDAYRLESQIAKFPRIVIPRAVAMDGNVYAQQGTHWKNYFEDRFLQSKDGPFHLHILRDVSRISFKVATRVSEPSGNDESALIIARQMRTAIQKRFDEASDNPDHFQKIAWFVEYWNAHIHFAIKGLETIETRPL